MIKKIFYLNQLVFYYYYYYYNNQKKKLKGLFEQSSLKKLNLSSGKIIKENIIKNKY